MRINLAIDDLKTTQSAPIKRTGVPTAAPDHFSSPTYIRRQGFTSMTMGIEEETSHPFGIQRRFYHSSRDIFT